MVNINLIPLDVRLSQAKRIRLVRWVSVVAMGVVILGVTLGFDWQRRAKASALHAEGEQTLLDVARARTRLRALTDELVQVENQVEHAKALRTKRAWSGIIGMVARCLPEQCWLASMATDPEKPGRTAVTPQRTLSTTEPNGEPDVVVIDAPRRLTIVGFAKEPSDPNTLVQRLQKEGVFSRVDLTNSHEEPVLDGTYYRFDIVCEW